MYAGRGGPEASNRSSHCAYHEVTSCVGSQQHCHWGYSTVGTKVSSKPHCHQKAHWVTARAGVLGARSQRPQIVPILGVRSLLDLSRTVHCMCLLCACHPLLQLSLFLTLSSFCCIPFICRTSRSAMCLQSATIAVFLFSMVDKRCLYTVFKFAVP